MEGIETADALLAQVYPKTDFETKDQMREKRANITIKRFRMDRLEKLLVPALPVSLMIDSTKKL